jgi:hypothetical protein
MATAMIVLSLPFPNWSILSRHHHHDDRWWRRRRRVQYGYICAAHYSYMKEVGLGRK